MRIGLISDTHGSFPETVFKYFEECDEIWHAGDIGNIDVLNKLNEFKPTKAVYGNIDGRDIRQECPEHLIFTIDGVKVFITHIGGYPGRYSPQARQIIDTEKPDLFICGHSHILKVMPDPKRPGLLHINPGAAGFHGFHRVMTLIRFTLEKGKVKNLQAIELGPRGSNFAP
jgi:putative phosphoesterase